jgi:hypothetical protein
MKNSTNGGLTLVISLLFQVAGLAGCGSPKFNQHSIHGAALPQVAPNQVQLFAAGEPPSHGFEILSPLSTVDHSSGSYRKAMQEAAAKLGADAVLGVHDFRAPRTVGIHLQSGIAVRLLPDRQVAPVSEAKSGVALVALLEAPIENTNTFAEIRDSMLLIGGLQLHTMGYCPIYVSAPLPSETNVPATATFQLLKDSEARLCEKMVVLRLTRRAQLFAGVGGRADVEIKAELIARVNNSVLWTNTLQVKRIGFGPGGGINVASTGFMGQAAAQAIRDMPKYRGD